MAILILGFTKGVNINNAFEESWIKKIKVYVSKNTYCNKFEIKLYKAFINRNKILETFTTNLKLN